MVNLLQTFFCLGALLVLPPSSFLVEAQLYQDYIPQRIQNPNGVGTIDALFYRGTDTERPLQVVDLAPQAVYLFYNCQYMRDICKNVANFWGTSRGQKPHPRSNLPYYVFGYDLNTARKRTSHSSLRREQSCPVRTDPPWKEFHICPESNQRQVMRHDGPWFTTELEPGTSINQLMNDRRRPGRIVESKVRYTCDEFPPATWVEGGNGIDGTDEAQTRCAALSCGKGAKAEQNWQAEAHSRLRRELNRIIVDRRQRYGQFAYYDSRNSVVLFAFQLSNDNDGIAARIWTYSDPALSQIEHESNVNQGYSKRGENGTEHDANSSTYFPTYKSVWPASPPTLEQLKAAAELGHGSETIIHANDSWVDWEDMAVMPRSDDDPLLRFEEWDAEDEHDDQDKIAKSGNHVETRSKQQPRYRSMSDPIVRPLFKRASARDVKKAREIVEKAISKSSKLNAARLAKPLRNKYRLKPGTVVGQGSVETMGFAEDDGDSVPPPLLEITDEIAEAAALVTEADAETGANSTKIAVAAAGTYWMQSLARKGTVPWGDDASYKVFRNVLDYGAVGDGVTDDTKAIKLAMTEGKRCGVKCNGSTTKNAIIYFPPGVYVVSTTIPLPFGTQVIGDANNRPTIKASKSFIGLGVLSTDEYTGGGTGTDGKDQQYYVNTANFYRQLRNIIIDVTLTRSAQKASALHYQVAQATSLQNVDLVAAPGSQQMGMYAENGSGGQISDVTFKGGAVGLYGGNQQFTAQRLTFDGCTTGVQVIWDWGWVWKSITMRNVDVGFRLVSDDGSGSIGSVSFIDSTFSNIGTAAVITAPISSKPGSKSTGIVFEKVRLSSVPIVLRDSTGKTILGSTGSVIDQWALGPVYEGSTDARSFSDGEKIGSYRRHSTLVDTDGMYFERMRPQYEDRSVGDFVHVKDMGARGDGKTDDTAAFQAALYASQGKVLFVDAGSYILTSTITIPQGSKIVGETWSQLVATGSYFQDASKPKVLIKVGNKGETGSVEMQDLIFTSRGPTAGLVVVEWNIAADAPGSAALWDCHVRLGGATGTDLTPAECPALTSGAVDNKCLAASLMFHLTSSGSGYFENMWLWGSDHMIDDPDLNDANNTMVQNSIFIARGFLIESTKPTWLYGTASEHAAFYQYSFHRAANIFAGMVQTESPYFQPSPPPPAPFKSVVGNFPGDPSYACTSGDEFSGCDESWGLIIRESENIFIAGAGIYSWFSSYSQDCIDVHACQKALLLLDSNFASVRVQNLITIGAKYMAVMDGKGIPALDNLNVKEHPSWSQVSILDVSSNGTQFNELVWIDPKIWDMEQPSLTCSPPCHLKIPPWTGATSTVNYPLLTVSDGTWKSTITKAPLTISQWQFDVVTLVSGAAEAAKNGDKDKRQNAAQTLWPKPATTSIWPAVVYRGPDGSETTTAPTVPFPKPPSTIGPGAQPPPTGSWPMRAIQVNFGLFDYPWVNECEYWDLGCQNPWIYGDDEMDPPKPIGDFDENWDDISTVCPKPTSSSSSSISKTTADHPPSSSPFEHGDPKLNKVKCYNSGENTEHVRMDSAANSFCNHVAEPGVIRPQGYMHSDDLPFDYNGGLGSVTIKVRFEVLPKCEWISSYDECRRYLSIPVDSCNCGGKDWKQGGVVDNNCLRWRIDPELTL